MTDRILVVDDDPQITSLLKRYLENQGFSVLCVATGQGLRDALAGEEIDLCILDLGLPDIDGFELTREIRATSSLPIIVLSVRNETFDRVVGLEYGADDYVTKPFEPRELVARIRSVLRRTRQEVPSPQQSRSDRVVLKFANWVMNLGERVLINLETGEDAGLTSLEFDLLRVFVEQPRLVLSRDQLLDLARGQYAVVGDRAIDVHIMRLRKKIEADRRQPRFIKTIHGIGYCFASDVTRVEESVSD